MNIVVQTTKQTSNQHKHLPLSSETNSRPPWAIHHVLNCIEAFLFLLLLLLFSNLSVLKLWCVVLIPFLLLQPQNRILHLVFVPSLTWVYVNNLAFVFQIFEFRSWMKRSHLHEPGLRVSMIWISIVDASVFQLFEFRSWMKRSHLCGFVLQ